jgi:hypothetical protein
MFSLSRSVVSSWRCCKPACLCFKPYVSCLPFSADLWKSKAALCWKLAKLPRKGKNCMSETVWIDWMDPKENPGTKDMVICWKHLHGTNMYKHVQTNNMISWPFGLKKVLDIWANVNLYIRLRRPTSLSWRKRRSNDEHNLKRQDGRTIHINLWLIHHCCFILVD